MSVLSIIAAIECEGCGKHFRVELDPASKTWRENEDGGVTVHFGSLFDAAVDGVRGGVVAPEKGGVIDFIAGSSVQDGKMLCPSCTAARDAACEKSPTGKHVWDDDDHCEHCGEAM